jgi:hypothetical protein
MKFAARGDEFAVDVLCLLISRSRFEGTLFATTSSDGMMAVFAVIASFVLAGASAQGHTRRHWLRRMDGLLELQAPRSSEWRSLGSHAKPYKLFVSHLLFLASSA